MKQKNPILAFHAYTYRDYFDSQNFGSGKKNQIDLFKIANYIFEDYLSTRAFNSTATASNPFSSHMAYLSYC